MMARGSVERLTFTGQELGDADGRSPPPGGRVVIRMELRAVPVAVVGASVGHDLSLLDVKRRRLPTPITLDPPPRTAQRYQSGSSSGRRSVGVTRPSQRQDGAHDGRP